MQPFLRNVIAAALPVAVSACGGGGGGVAFIPAPVASPSPPTFPSNVPPPPGPPAQDLVAPALTSTPPSPSANGSASFANPAAGTVFPLLLTAVGPAFSGDSATVSAGGTLEAGTGGLGLTLNNSALQVSGASPNAYPYNRSFYAPNGQPVVASVGAGDNLDYTRFGFWTLPNSNPYYDIGGGSWLAGYVTPASQIPTSGTANYAGRVVGLASSYPVCGCDDFKDFEGIVNMSANFGTKAVSGSMTGLKFTDIEFSEIPLNDVGFAATLDPAHGTFAGTTSATSFPVNPFQGFNFAVNPGASGAILGQFFGPSAQEAGAVWTLSDGVHRLTGSFGAKGP